MSGHSTEFNKRQGCEERRLAAYGFYKSLNLFEKKHRRLVVETRFRVVPDLPNKAEPALTGWSYGAA